MVHLHIRNRYQCSNYKCRFYPKLSLDEIENEIISDGVRRLSPVHQRPSGRRRSLSAEDNTSYWNRVFSSRDSEEIDSSEAQERFNKFVKKKWCYGKDPAKKGVIDQIEHSVAITVSESILKNSRQSMIVFNFNSCVGFWTIMSKGVFFGIFDH